MKPIIPELPEDNFTWERWRWGNYVWEALGFRPRYAAILDHKEALRRYAVGYTLNVSWRNRPSSIAVMFLIDDEFGWTHLRKDEFERVFT